MFLLYNDGAFRTICPMSTTPSTSAPARDAWLCVLQLFISEENQRRFVETAGELSLTPAGLKALLTMDGEEPKAMRVLAAEWHCDPSTVTAVVDQLEQGGYAERRTSATDRRVKTVSLTVAGGDARRTAMQTLSQPPAGIRALSAGDQRALADLLRQATADLPPLR
jgi:DNA-binding MarR family transcriptional regulator